MDIKNPPTIRKLMEYRHVDRRMRALLRKTRGKSLPARTAAKIRLSAVKPKRTLARKSLLNSETKNMSKNKVGFVSARSALMMHLPIQLAVGEKFFTENLYLSTNFSDQTRVDPTPLLDAENPKHFNQLLLIRDVDSSGKVTYKGVMIDAADAGQLHALLDADRKADDQTGVKRQIAIIHPDMGIIDQGKNAINPDELNNPDVVALTAQAKLIGGQTKFTEAEKDYLKEKVQMIDESSKKAAYKGNDIFHNLVKHLSPMDMQKENPTGFSRLLL